MDSRVFITCAAGDAYERLAQVLNKAIESFSECFSKLHQKDRSSIDLFFPSAILQIHLSSIFSCPLYFSIDSSYLPIGDSHFFFSILSCMIFFLISISSKIFFVFFYLDDLQFQN